MKVPVIAAGGIADGRGIAAALALGASAAQIGTAFLACEESNAAPAHRAKLFSADAKRTSLDRVGPARSEPARLLFEHVLDQLATYLRDRTLHVGARNQYREITDVGGVLLLQVDMQPSAWHEASRERGPSPVLFGLHHPEQCFRECVTVHRRLVVVNHWLLGQISR